MVKIRTIMLSPNKCHGCDCLAKTKKGWCSKKCYLNNQSKVYNKGRFEQGHILTKDHIDTLKRLGEIRGKDKNWVKAFVERTTTPEVNAKKSNRKEKHPKWISDRTKLKQKRCTTEEQEFFKEVLKERSYRCEVTGEVGGKLSIHHLDSVHLFPEKQFVRENVVVIKKEVHLDFHRQYGYQWATREKWIDYLSKNYKNAVCQ